VDSIANYVSEERDILYRRGEIKGIEKGMEKGIEKGEEKAKTEVVKNLLNTGKYPDTEIAALVGVPEAFVIKVKGTVH
jgi:predicted transposase/invertase (TIGR01784 family)